MSNGSACSPLGGRCYDSGYTVDVFNFVRMIYTLASLVCAFLNVHEPCPVHVFYHHITQHTINKM